MALTRLRTLACLLAVFLGFPAPSPAFDTPLSDTAVREAYFLGQHRDQIIARFRKVMKSSLIMIWLPFAELRYSARLRLITYPSFSSRAKISVRSN